MEIIEIQRKIEEEVRNRSPFNTIFKRKTFILKFIIPLCVIEILLMIPYFYYLRNLYIQFLLLVVMGIIAILYFFVFINPYVKKHLIKKGEITYRKGFWEHWANESYIAYKYKSFRNRLVELNILVEGNPDLNSRLLKEYSDFYRTKADRIKGFEVLKPIGSPFLLFTLPVWGGFLGKLFELSKLEELIEAVKISSQFLFMIFTLIVAVVYFQKMLKELIENRKRRFLQISDELLNLKWNEDLINSSSQQEKAYL